VRPRRMFTSVPTVIRAAWVCSQLQAIAWEAWFKNAVTDGVDWFDMDLQTALGTRAYTARFASMYEGPRLIAYRTWEFSADLELRERPVLLPPWGEIGVEFILGADIIDLAMNAEWPG
jgi:hypothetical protein